MRIADRPLWAASADWERTATAPSWRPESDRCISFGGLGSSETRPGWRTEGKRPSCASTPSYFYTSEWEHIFGGAELDSNILDF